MQRASALRMVPIVVYSVLMPAGAAGSPAAAPPEAGSMELPEAERLAVAASPALRAAEARVLQEEGMLRQAGLYPNPELTLDASRFTHDWEPRETILSLRQPFPWHGKRDLHRRETEERIAAAQADLESVRLDLVLKVRESFYRIAFADKILELDRENLDAARAIHSAVEARVAAGDAAPFEALKAAVEVSRAESDVRQVDGELRAETAVFNLLLGLPASAATTPVMAPPAAEPDAELPDLLSRAGEAQPEIRARQHLALAAGLAVDRARLEPRPDVAVGPAFGVDQGDTLFGVGVSLRLPLWDRSQGRIAAAEAGRQEASAQVDAARLSVSSLVADAYGLYRSASALKRLYEEGLLVQSDSLVELTRKSYEGGATGILDLLDARRTALAVKEDYYRACLDAAVAAARLRRAVGEGEPPR